MTCGIEPVVTPSLLKPHLEVRRDCGQEINDEATPQHVILGNIPAIRNYCRSGVSLLRHGNVEPEKDVEGENQSCNT